jgi:hypothetical protein
MAEAITGTEKLGAPGRMASSKRLIVILVLSLAIPVVWFTVFRSTASPAATCDSQYDALVQQAKAELTNGNRTAAINFLIAARNKLRDCQTPTAKDVAPMWGN